MHANSITDFQVSYKYNSSNRIKIQVILLILQLEADYFFSLFISEMLHSKQWHYSLHRDFQKLHSTHSMWRDPPGFFNSTYYKGTHTRKEILHPENKELFNWYYIQRAKRPSFQKRYSTHRGQRDLWFTLQDIPDIPVICDIQPP